MLKSLGKKAYIDYKCFFRYPRQIKIGSNTIINRECKFYASFHKKDIYIQIGNHVAVAPQCSFFAASHDYTKRSLPDIAGSIIIEDYVWIGGKSIILPNVTIKEGAIVAAGSVVTKDVESYTIVAGSPARVIGHRNIIE